MTRGRAAKHVAAEVTAAGQSESKGGEQRQTGPLRARFADGAGGYTFEHGVVACDPSEVCRRRPTREHRVGRSDGDELGLSLKTAGCRSPGVLAPRVEEALQAAGAVAVAARSIFEGALDLRCAETR